MSGSNIIIFSRPVQTGKTTNLFEFIKSKKSAGFLTPDVDGRRVLFDIFAQQYFPFEVENTQTNETVSIGRFHFLQSSFVKGMQLLEANIDADYIIVDEVGKLEIEADSGFEPCIANTINTYKLKQRKGTLILVVRDTLLQKAITKYGLREAQIINKL